MKLTRMQLFWIVATIEVVMAVWLRISPAITDAKQDAWLSILIGGLMGLAMTFFVVHLSMLHPNESLAEFSQKLLGKWLGRLVILPYLTAWFILAGDVMRTFADFIHLILLDSTPVWVIMLLMLALMLYMTLNGGLSGIGRFCEIAGPVTLAALVVSFLLNLGNIEWHYMKPFYADSGWQAILKASYPPASFFGESFMLLVIVSYLDKPRKAMPASLLSVAITLLFVIAAAITCLLVFGPNVAAKMRFPYFMLVRTIDIFNFIQNLDIFVIFIWVFGVFAKLSFYLFLTSSEMARSARIHNWRKLIWFTAPMILVIAAVIPNEDSIEPLQKLWRLIVIPICAIGIPLILWIVTLVRKTPTHA
ncbi:spore germination protein (amino acid permease) [Paenibacillus taihuensis]|uniref:Spore germination protein (Amino acid permease) n=1 Tax=Paenibacillus taihuensis TaxID=1156355 RepID=A0A3D9RNJ7_9BACL|nr:endospore germination permease [Paenibacillus taihuensis]REE81479.1 spore germination protein (amino acid permease) [Paenibacillus taihuensis]